MAEPAMPGNEIVGQFTEHIRTTITGAVKAATAAITKRITYWCIATIILSMLGAGLVAWLIASPRPATTQFVLQHADGAVEICSRTADSGPPHSVFICRLDHAR